MRDLDHAVACYGGGDSGGCLVEADAAHQPSLRGPLIDLNATGRLHAAVDAAAALGGAVLEPLHAIGPHGFRAIVRDSEGHRVALHAPPG